VDCEARLADERDSTPLENMRGERMRAILAHSGDRSFWPIGYEFGPFVPAQAGTQIFYFSAGFPASAGTNGFGSPLQPIADPRHRLAHLICRACVAEAQKMFAVHGIEVDAGGRRHAGL